jgi:hypothetical protein
MKDQFRDIMLICLSWTEKGVTGMESKVPEIYGYYLIGWDVI